MSEELVKPEKLTRDEDINEILISNEVTFLDVVYDIKLTPTVEEIDAGLAKLVAQKDTIHDGFPSAEKHRRGIDDGIVRLNYVATLLKSREAYAHKLIPPRHHPYVRIHNNKFRFPNDHRRYESCIHAAFQQNGFQVADIQKDSLCWTWVLTTDGDLWLHDTSHGGGGEFSLYSRAK